MPKGKSPPIKELIIRENDIVLSVEFQKLILALKKSFEEENASDNITIPVIPNGPFSNRELQLLKVLQLLYEVLASDKELIKDLMLLLEDVDFRHLAEDEVTKKTAYHNYIKQRLFGYTSEKTVYLQEEANAKEEKKARGTASKSRGTAKHADGKTEETMPPKGNTWQVPPFGSMVETSSAASFTSNDSSTLVTKGTLKATIDGVAEAEGVAKETEVDTTKKARKACNKDNNPSNQTITEIPSKQDGLGEIENHDEPQLQRTRPNFTRKREGTATSPLKGRCKNYSPRQEGMIEARSSNMIKHVIRFTSEDDDVGLRNSPPLDAVGEAMKYRGCKYIKTIYKECHYIVAIDYYRQTFESKTLRNENDSPVKIYTPVPASIDRGMYIDEETFAKIVVDKFSYAIPIDRQIRRFNNMGLFLNKGTVNEWINKTFEEKISVILEEMWNQMRNSTLIHLDLSWARVQQEEGRTSHNKSQVVCYATGADDPHPFILFDYATNKSSSYLEGFLKGFKGKIVTDAGSEFNWIPPEQRVKCLGHARQEIFRALPTEPEIRRRSRAYKLLCQFDKVFETERIIKAASMNAQEKRTERQQKLWPEILKMETMMIEAKKNASPKCALYAAIQYYENHRNELLQCLLDGNVPLTNMRMENFIRIIAMLRNVIVQFGSPRGARASLGWVSLCCIARENNLDEEKYICYILRKTREPGWKKPENLRKLVAWDENIQAACRRGEQGRNYKKKGDVEGHRFCGQ